ncbi:histidine triad nucleotide-binding protein [Oxalobacter aliiformigenes]|uniref:Histidine triad nucleotide-binding protein n=1 Tax=Oxalobacter aliiformigenes TaxID=2946593 RepID=A0ABY7JLN2_9BURK|nr:histidine triad nucleotide-binding protein [Oxalobacter aliiformigenes]WAV93471.1 histidine triad nucleotide-binding protein [Oxalobacter aliiformigenes]WAV95032.1 histidine triad nucleotide-binding protein [Oxalobacter aliiformigenes]WAV97167.1 histidine triad nucleotide-binding protein [Oxalobacter aliiformigenes]
MEDCIFCKIVKKELPSTLVFENERIMVFKDIHPAAPVHLLIIPQKHIPTLSHCSEDDAALLGEMMALIPKLAREEGIAVSGTETGTPQGGFRVVVNTGPDGKQDVYHMHIHLMGGPRPWKTPN